MNNIFLVCMGGSGSKVLEAVTHMAALDAWKGVDIHVLTVDVDGGNGNQNRTSKTIGFYEQIRKMNIDPEHGMFKSAIHLYKWLPTLKDTNLLNMARKGENSKSTMLSKFLFSRSEREMSIDNGFKGHPNIGVLFMQTILANRDPHNRDELTKFVDAALDPLNRADRIMLIGSCYGGTGASCIPVIGRYLRLKTGGKIPMSLLSILPSFSLNKNSKFAIDPDSNEFPDRVKTVLSTYISENILEYYPENDYSAKPRDLFEKIYLIGSPKPILFPKYASGKSNQKNPATFFDWFACSAIAHYMREDAQSLNGKAVLTAWVEQTPWNWTIFSALDFPNLCMRATRLMIAVGLFMSEIHLSMDSLLSTNSSNRQNYIEMYFRSVPTEGFEKLHSGLDAFSQYSAALVLWFYHIVTHLPANMFPEVDAQNRKKLLSAEKLALKFDELKATQNDRVYLTSLYYQLFFNRSAIFRMEKLRQQFWPRSNDDDNKEQLYTKAFLNLYKQIFNDTFGAEEEKSLGVLLPDITHSKFYKKATSDRLMGRIFVEGEYPVTNKEESVENAIPHLLRSVFAAIDQMERVY